MDLVALFMDIEAAQMVFNEIAERDLSSWNAIINGYVNCRKYKEALMIFTMLMRDGFILDEVTLVLALSARDELGELHIG
jgi:pentatricopeptide repeat protein